MHISTPKKRIGCAKEQADRVKERFNLQASEDFVFCMMWAGGAVPNDKVGRLEIWVWVKLTAEIMARLVRFHSSESVEEIKIIPDVIINTRRKGPMQGSRGYLTSLPYGVQAHPIEPICRSVWPQ